MPGRERTRLLQDISPRRLPRPPALPWQNRIDIGVYSRICTPHRTFPRFIRSVVYSNEFRLVPFLHSNLTHPQTNTQNYIYTCTDDISDAILSLSDSFSVIGRMSRIQSLIHAEDVRDELRATAHDLRGAVHTLSSPSIAPYLPPDAQEDLNLLQRQLLSLKFASGARPHAVLAASHVVTAVTLHSVDPAVDVVGPVQHALGHVGLGSMSAAAWVDEEVELLARAAVGALTQTASIADPIDGFILVHTALALLEWHRLSSNTNGTDSVHSIAPVTVLLSTAQEKLHVIEDKIEYFDTYNALEDDEIKLKILCEALLGSSAQQQSATTTFTSFANNQDNQEEDCQSNDVHPSPGRELAQFKASILANDLFERRTRLQATAAAVAIQALVHALDTTSHPLIRAATATALRTLCREPAWRQKAAGAGALRPLSRHLGSPHAAPRRAASKALSNLLITDEGMKKEAIEKFSVAQSLVAMLHSEDALGQEAAASALANLAANSESVQSAICRHCDVFTPLSEVLRNPMSLPATHVAAARAVKNLTSRVHANKMKAAHNGGIVSGLVGLIKSAQEGTTKAAALAALATLTDGCGEAITQALASGVCDTLVDILEEYGGAKVNTSCSNSNGSSDVELTCCDAAAVVLVHIVPPPPTPSPPFSSQQQHYQEIRPASAPAQIPATPSTPNTTTTATPTTPEHHVAPYHSTSSISICSLNLLTIPALVSILRPPSSTTIAGKRAAARLLSWLARSPASKRAVVEGGGVAALVACLASPHDGLQRQGATTLCTLLHRCDAGRAALCDSPQGIARLVGLLTPKKDAAAVEQQQQYRGTQKEAARAISILCANNSCHQGEHVGEAGAIPALQAIIEQGLSATCSSSSSSSPSLAADSPFCSTHSSSSTATPPPPPPPVAGAVEAAAAALSNIACVPSNQSRMAEARVATSMLKLLQPQYSTGMTGRHTAARALSNLMADGFIPGDIATSSSVQQMVRDLVQLAEDGMRGSRSSESSGSSWSGDESCLKDDIEAQVAVAGALGNLSCILSIHGGDRRSSGDDVATEDAVGVDTGAEAVARCGGAALLCSLCRSKTPAVRESAVQGLWEVCRGSQGARSVAVTSGVVPWLVQLLAVGGEGEGEEGSDSAQEAAAGCMAELARDGGVACEEAERAGAVGLLQRLVAGAGAGGRVGEMAGLALRAIQERKFPDSQSIENELSQRLSLLREAGSRRWESGSEEVGGEGGDRNGGDMVVLMTP